MPKLGLTDSFLRDVGHFYGLWSALETTIDYMIGKLLKITHEETHILTASMEFGRKADVLRALLARSNHPEKDRLGQLLTIIQEEAKRNIFTHSIMRGDDDSVTFVHRKLTGKYRVVEMKFTGPEFNFHVGKITSFASDLKSIMKLDPSDFQAFGTAAKSAESNPSTSPTPPSSSE